MAEIDYEGILEKFGVNRTLEKSESDKEMDAIDERTVAFLKELLEKARPIVETRNKIMKANDDLVTEFHAIRERLDILIMLKSQNVKEEAEMIQLIKNELLGRR